MNLDCVNGEIEFVEIELKRITKELKSSSIELQFWKGVKKGYRGWHTTERDTEVQLQLEMGLTKAVDHENWASAATYAIRLFARDAMKVQAAKEDDLND